MQPCSGCGTPTNIGTTIASCQSCQDILSAFIAALTPGKLKADIVLSPARRLAFMKVQQMARELADSAYVFSDMFVTDERLAKYIATVEAMWSAYQSGTGGPGGKLRDLLN